MYKTLSEDGCGISKKSNVWKLYVFAGGIAGSFNEQNRVKDYL
jgi:hypothetical protein